jgi:putative restriction endonuclease
MPDKLLTYYTEVLTSLKRDNASEARSGFAAPHQPVLVLSLIEAFERGLIRNENVYLTPELVDLFTTNWSLLVNGGNYHPIIAQPFYYVKSKVNRKDVRWWRLVPNPGCEIWLENASSMRSFRNLMQAVDHAEIDLELAITLSISENRQILRQAVLKKYFPDKVGVDLSSVGTHFDQISDDMVNEAPGTYVANLRHLKETMSGDDKQRELFQQELYVRGGVFKRDVPKYYRYTCCISRLKVDATFSVSMIDACHIKPFSKSYNDTITNGIALCPNLHRAFDRGMISVDDNLQVIVSQRFTENPNAIYSFSELAGTSLLLPLEPRFHPLAENFAWHRKNIFKF